MMKTPVRSVNKRPAVPAQKGNNDHSLCYLDLVSGWLVSALQEPPSWWWFAPKKPAHGQSKCQAHQRNHCTGSGSLAEDIISSHSTYCTCWYHAWFWYQNTSLRDWLFWGRAPSRAQNHKTASCCEAVQQDRSEGTPFEAAQERSGSLSPIGPSQYLSAFICLWKQPWCMACYGALQLWTL